jgi:hypothetical protein
MAVTVRTSCSGLMVQAWVLMKQPDFYPIAGLPRAITARRPVLRTLFPHLEIRMNSSKSNEARS